MKIGGDCAVTLRMDVSALSIDSERLSNLFATYLPAAKQEGF